MSRKVFDKDLLMDLTKTASKLQSSNKWENSGFFYLQKIVNEIDSINHVLRVQQFFGLKQVSSKPRNSTKLHLCHSSKKAYIIKRPWVHMFFQVSRYGGEELLFLLIFPFIMWCLDLWILRRVSFMFAFCMFVCTAAKDLIAKGRPLSPPVLRLEKRSADEFGLPSTHAVAITSTLIPLLTHTAERYLMDWPSWIVSCMWMMVLVTVVCVCLSRVYNGMHSFLDVICGLLASIVIMCFTPITKLDLLIDSYLTAEHSFQVPLILALGGLLFSWSYPKMKRWNTGRGDSILLVGMHMGYLIGSWFNQSEYSIALMGLFSARVHNHSLPVSSNATTVLYRMAVGLPLVFIIRLAIRMMVLNVIFLIAREDTSNAEAIKKPNIELFHKYFSYLLLGFTGVALVPVFASLGL